MQEFNFLKFDTKYKAVISSPDCSRTVNALNGEACFGSVFGAYITKDTTVKYTIHINKDINYLKEKHKNNLCLLNYHQVYKHISILKNYFPFELVIKNTDSEYIVCIKLSGVEKICHKFLLTWVRYLYEFPFNMCIHDVLRLKKCKESKFISTVNLANIVMQVEYPHINQHGVGIHSIIENDNLYRPLTNKNLKNRLQDDVYEVNNIFNSSGQRVCPRRNPKDLNYRDLEYWNEENFINKRKDRYIRAIKLCRKM